MRATILPLRSLGPRTCTSLAGKPASRRRLAIASAATVVLPTESVVLISTSCLKMSRESCLVASSRFGEVDAIAEAVESGALGLVAQAGLRAGCFGEGDAAAVACQQQIAFRFGL